MTKQKRIAGIETTPPDLRRRKPGVCLTGQPEPLDWAD